MQRALVLDSETEKNLESRKPLAERLRPKSWDDFEGIEGLNAYVFEQLRSGVGKPPSCILWGPPGVGKTTIATLIGKTFDLPFKQLSAVLSGVKEIRDVFAEAKKQTQPTILFIDEIHRFNKSQQDAFLPYVEDGTIILIGATTENPSFYVTSALLSRCSLLVLQSLDEAALQRLITRAKTLLGIEIESTAEVLLTRAAAGDGRRLLNLTEGLFTHLSRTGSLHAAVSQEAMTSYLLHQPVSFYDRDGEEHYNIVSAFIKSMRGSDADGALFWAFKMIESGEDPRFVIRRMMIFASEDIGNADPRALLMATATADAFERLGLPEGKIPLAHCITYLATAPKSNRSYTAMHGAIAAVKQNPKIAVPMHLRNAPTKMMKQLDYGKGYQYPHDASNGYVVGEAYLPSELKGVQFYSPSDRGYEKTIAERLQILKTAKKKI